MTAKASRDVSVRFKDARANFGGTKDQWWPDFLSQHYPCLPRLRALDPIEAEISAKRARWRG